MRLFLGIKISPENALYLEKCAVTLSEASGNNYAPCLQSVGHHMHITLKYIGETDKVDEILKRLDTVRFGKFSVDIEGTGAFERAAWAKPHDEIKNLHMLKALFDNALDGIVEPENRDYIPHVTLCYKRSLDVPACDTVVPRIHENVEAFSLFEVFDETLVPVFREIRRYPLFDMVTLVSINDFHASLKNAPSLVSSIKRMRAQNPLSAVFFGGDNYFGNPIIDKYDGRPVSRIMKELGVSFSALGNHDYDYGWEKLRIFERDGGYRFLSANLAGLPGYAFLDIGKYRILILGLATPDETPSPETDSSIQDTPIEPPLAAALRISEKLKKEPCDAMVALTHLGIREDTENGLYYPEAEEVCITLPNLDGLFGAHYHRFIRDYINGVPIAEGGSQGLGYAVIRIVFHDKGKVSFPDYVRIESKDQDEETLRIIQDFEKETEWMKNEIICSIPHDIGNRNPDGEIPMEGSLLSRLAVNVVREATGADVVLLYSGRVGLGLSRGSLSLYDLERSVMLSNPLVQMTLSAEKLLETISLGLRTLNGEGASPLSEAGIRMEINPGNTPGQRIIWCDIRPGQKYSVVTDSSVFMGNFGFTVSEYAEDVRKLDVSMKEIIREFFLLCASDSSRIDEYEMAWVRRVQDES